MDKKGQVTIFVIIAIVIVASIAAFYMFRGETDNRGTIEVPAEVAPVKNYVDACINSAIEKYVYAIGEGGGHVFTPFLSDVDGFTYYFWNGETYVPTKKEMKERLSLAIVSNVIFCVDNFRAFPDLEIEAEAPMVDVDIQPEVIFFNVNYPMSIRKGEELNFLDDFGEFTYSVKLGFIHSVVEDLVRDDVYSYESICVSCFVDSAFENNLTIDLLDGEEYGSIFIITDEIHRIVEGEEEVISNVDNETDRVFKFIFASD